MKPRWRSTGARARVGRLGPVNDPRGIDVVTLENSLIRVTFAASKGAEIIEFVDKRIDLDYCSYSEAGPVSALPFTALASDDVATFHDGYTGGWQQIFPNGGAPSTYRGARLGQHAEAAGSVWFPELLLDTPDEVVVRFRTELLRVPFSLERTVSLRVGSSRLELGDSATNHSPGGMHAMWGQHLIFGKPFLQTGCRIRFPADTIVTPDESHSGEVQRGTDQLWPLVECTAGGTTDLSFVPADDAPSEMLYLHGFKNGWYELSSARSHIRVDWDAEQLPFLWMWREFGQSSDYPFWGNTYALGLEPFSSMPTTGLADAVKNGTSLNFLGGETKTLLWSINVSVDAPSAKEHQSGHQRFEENDE
ncbi:MAG: DUF4432 family protein [Rhodoglobus sp.]